MRQTSVYVVVMVSWARNNCVSHRSSGISWRQSAYGVLIYCTLIALNTDTRLVHCVRHDGGDRVRLALLVYYPGKSSSASRFATQPHNYTYDDVPYAAAKCIQSPNKKLSNICVKYARIRRAPPVCIRFIWYVDHGTKDTTICTSFSWGAIAVSIASCFFIHVSRICLSTHVLSTVGWDSVGILRWAKSSCQKSIYILSASQQNMYTHNMHM